MISSTLRSICAFALAACCGAQALAQPAAPIPSVTVSTTRDPVDKSYRKMIKGMDRFEREHALAPAATLRFRLLPRLSTAKMTGITLRVAGDNVTLPVPVAEDNSFVLPRNEQALREDAAVLANRKTNSMTWRASVQTPGLPDGVRRLGDLRLECKVGMDAGLISNSAPIFGWLSNMLTDTDKVCSSADGNYLFFAERPIFGVTLRAGAAAKRCRSRCCTRPATRPPRRCRSAIARCCSTAVTTRRSGTAAGPTTRWSSSTTSTPPAGARHEAPGHHAVRARHGRLRHHAAGAARHGGAGSPAGTGGSTGRHHQGGMLLAQLGPTTSIRFDSGYEVWRYLTPAARRQATANSWSSSTRAAWSPGPAARRPCTSRRRKNS